MKFEDVKVGLVAVPSLVSSAWDWLEPTLEGLLLVFSIGYVGVKLLVKIKEWRGRADGH